MELDDFRKAFDDWLDEHADELAPDFEGGGTLDEQMAQIAKVRHLTFDAGWARYGWPEQVGGLGGSTLLRAYLSEALTAQRSRVLRRLLVARGARPVVRHLRVARPLGGDDPAAAARRRGLVPGVLRAGNRQQPRLAHVPGGAPPTTGGG